MLVYNVNILVHPIPTITWYKDGKPIPNNDQRFVITQETPTLSVLTINNTNMDDKGVYSVKLTNIAGEIEGKANLNVKRKFKENFQKSLFVFFLYSN